MLRVGGLTCDVIGMGIYLFVYSFESSVYSKTANTVYNTEFEVP
jgi:hypothetical protein